MDWIPCFPAALLRACACTYIQALAHVRGSAHFHTPQSLACTVKASAPPGTLQSRSPNLLVHEAASARRNLDRPLSPRPGHLTPFIIGSLPTSLLRRHHQPFSPSSPFHQLSPLPAAAGSAAALDTDPSNDICRLRRRHFLPNTPLNSSPQLERLYLKHSDFSFPFFSTSSNYLEKDERSKGEKRKKRSPFASSTVSPSVRCLCVCNWLHGKPTFWIQIASSTDSSSA